MAAELKVFHAVTLAIDGVVFPGYGSLLEPVKGAGASIDGGKNPIRRRVNVPAGQSVLAWTWADTGGFSYLAAKLMDGAGYLQAALRYSKITSATDLTPTGANPAWKERGMSCVAPAEWDTARAYCDTVSDAVVSQEVGGLPSVWASANKSLGVADRLAFRNEGTTDIVVDVLIVPL